MKKAGFPTSPFVLGAVLGGMIEEKFRQALLISDGSFSVFLSDPITVVLFILTIGSFFLPVFQRMRKSKATQIAA